MADKRISELNTGTPLADADLLPVAQETSPGVYSTIKATLANLRTHLLATFSDLFVNTAGDTMTGNLNFQNGSDTGFIGILAGGDMNISPDDNNHILYLNAATADTGNTGQTITGRFRAAMPVEIRNTSVTIQSGPTGVGSALVRCASVSPVTLTIRKNDGTAGADFQIGNYYSVLQEGVGAVTLVGQTGNVVLNRAATFTGNTTREQYSVITATLYSITGGVETWVITGDLVQA